MQRRGWIELFGRAWVDPLVYGFVHYDPKKVAASRSGIGIDRWPCL